MALTRKIKAPKVFQGTPGRATRYARSSTKAPKAKGIDPNSLGYGITNTSSGDQGSLGARASKLFGIGSASSGQGGLQSKAKKSF
jgi:hypothetical protein